jgi:hypothetical protein
MVRKLRVCVLSILIIQAVLLYVQGNAAEIDADPLFSYETHDDDYTLRSLGPVLEFSPHVSAVRPFYFKDRDTSETDILYPLGRFTKERGFFFPLYRRTDEDDQKHTDLFPVFYGKYKEAPYWGIFPLYGTMEHRFGYTRARFILFPLYSETVLDGVTTYSFLWPVFSFSQGRIYKVFPLYGWEKSSDTTKQFFLWPIFSQRRGPDSRKMDAALPLFMYDRGPAYRNFSLVWPFFNYNHDYSNKHVSADFPWPLVRYASGAYEETRIFPFYWVKTDKNYSRKAVLWPVWSRSSWHYEDKGVDEQTTMVLLTNWMTRKSVQGVQTSKKLVLWPFLYTYQEGSRSEWYFPSIIPLFFDEGFSRIWGPVLSLAQGTSDETSSETSILWRTVAWGRNGDTRKWSLAFLACSTENPEYHEWGFLGNMLTFRRYFDHENRNTSNIDMN